MAQQTFGEVSWDNSYGGSAKKSNSKDLFLKLVDGDNILRIITRPQQYIVHKVKFGSLDKYGQKVGCSKLHGSCPICDLSENLMNSAVADEVKRGKDMKAKARWYVGALSRVDGKAKILDISWTVFDQIKKLAVSKHWGSPNGYDINVLLDRNGGATGYYNVQPLSKSPLTAEEQLLVDSFPLEDLQTRVTPPKLETVMKRVEFLEKQYQYKLFEPTVDNSSNDEESESDDSEDFPSFND